MHNSSDDKIRFFKSAVKYYTGINKTFSVCGFDARLDQDVADKLDVEAHELAMQIVGDDALPLWVPANEFQAARLRKAYTDRGLKAAA